jgi:hypothetical protein
VIPHRRKDGTLVVPADAVSPDGLPLLGGTVRVVRPGDPDFARLDEWAIDTDSDFADLIEESEARRREPETPRHARDARN